MAVTTRAIMVIDNSLEVFNVAHNQNKGRTDRKVRC